MEWIGFGFGLDSMIQEGCNETLHNGVTELHRQEFSYSAGVSVS